MTSPSTPRRGGPDHLRAGRRARRLRDLPERRLGRPGPGPPESGHAPRNVRPPSGPPGNGSSPSGTRAPPSGSRTCYNPPAQTGARPPPPGPRGLNHPPIQPGPETRPQVRFQVKPQPPDPRQRRGPNRLQGKTPSRLLIHSKSPETAQTRFSEPKTPGSKITTKPDG